MRGAKAVSIWTVYLVVTTATLSCGPPPPTANSSPSSSPSPSAKVSPLALSCRLPVAAADAPADGNALHGTTGSGGFVTFPSASFSKDPRSQTTFDAKSGKWLPVPRAWVWPGALYAFVVNSPEPVVHVVVIFTGSDNAFPITDKVASSARTSVGPMAMLAFEPQAIYLVHSIPNSDAPPRGLAWMDASGWSYLDPVAGTTPDESYLAVHNGFAYQATNGRGADTIPQNGPRPYWNEIFAHRISTSSMDRGVYGGAYRDNAWLRLLGFDGGEQAVMSAESATEYAVYTGALFGQQAPTRVFSGRPGDPNNPIGPVVGDGSGIWFGSNSGMVWYYPGGGVPLLPVAVVPFSPVRVAGPCTHEPPSGG